MILTMTTLSLIEVSKYLAEDRIYIGPSRLLLFPKYGDSIAHELLELIL